MWKIFPRISICSNFCLLRISALPPERRTRKQKTDRKEASTFREQLFSHKLPFCPYKQKLLVRQNLKELLYSGKTIAFKHLNIINVYFISAAKRLSNKWLFNFINQIYYHYLLFNLCFLYGGNPLRWIEWMLLLLLLLEAEIFWFFDDGVLHFM